MRTDAELLEIAVGHRGTAFEVVIYHLQLSREEVKRTLQLVKSLEMSVSYGAMRYGYKEDGGAV